MRVKLATYSLFHVISPHLCSPQYAFFPFLSVRSLAASLHLRLSPALCCLKAVVVYLSKIISKDIITIILYWQPFEVLLFKRCY